MKTQYEKSLKRSYNQVKKWRTAFYLYEDKKGAKDRFISLLKEELKESADAVTKTKALDLYVDVVFYCLSSAIEGGLIFEDIKRWYLDDGYNSFYPTNSWKNLGKALQNNLLEITSKNWELSDILSHTLVIARTIYEGRLTHEEFFEAFDKVYKNNMKKFWTFAEWYSSNYIIGFYTERKGPRCLVVKDLRGKIMKPPGFKGVKL